MSLSRLDLAAVAALALVLLWIEHDHRVVISTPAAAEGAPRTSSACPETDDVPFGAACLSFIGVGAQVAERPNVALHAVAVSSVAPGRTAAHDPACPPSNENTPYSASCIRFLSGWYWQPDAAAQVP